MTKQYVRILIAMISIFISTGSQAVPWWAPTGLPLEGMFGKSKSDQEVAAQLVNGLLRMQFFQDTEQRDLYYLVPVYRAVNDTVAGTSIINYSHVNRMQKIWAISERISQELGKDLEEINKIDALIRTEITKEQPNEGYIARLTVQRTEEYARMATGKNLVPYADWLGFLLASSRIVAQPEESLLDRGVRERYIAEANKLVAGQLTVNISAQLDQQDEDTLAAYMRLRAKKGLPPLRLQTMPLLNQVFTSLNESATEDKAAAQSGIPLLPSIVGRGSFKAATLDMALSSDAASAFGTAPIPLILPVAVMAKSVVAFPPFEADLHCDFHLGETLEYFARITDGAMWNDLVEETSEIKPIGPNSKPCQLIFTGGQGDEARMAAIKVGLGKLQEELVKNVLAESNASAAEMRKLEAELRNNTKDHTRSGKQGNNEALIDWYIHTKNVQGHDIKGPHQGRRLMIHTNKTTVSRLRDLKIDLHLSDKTNSQILIDIPAQICLAYYPAGRYYVACGKVELASAGGVLDAKKASLDSPLCQGKTVEECAKIRATNAPRSESGNILSDSSKESK